MFTPTPDPVPWVTDGMRSAGAFRTQTDEVYDYKSQNYIDRERTANDAAAALLDSLSATVNALHNDERAYQVVLSKDNASAATLLEKRIVEIGSKPFTDTDLTEGQRAAVMAGLATHEAGHIRYGRGWKGALTRHFGKDKVTPAILLLSNLAADMHDEAEMVAYAPGISDAIAVTLWWVAGKGIVTEAPDLSTVQSRVHAAIAACRYADTTDWPTDEHAAWLDWWTEWGKQARNAGRPKDHAQVVEDAIRKCRDVPPQPEQPSEQPQQPQPQQGKGSEPPPMEQPSGSDEQPQPSEQPGDEQGDEQGEGEQPSQPGDEPDDEQPEPGPVDETGAPGKGGSMDDGTNLDEPTTDEYRVNPDDVCPLDKARDRNDAFLQDAAEHEWRGQRAGLRRRVYKHKSSMWGNYESGRTVVTMPFKGGRWSHDA